MGNETPTIYIIAEPNGAGKTTFASDFLPDYVAWVSAGTAPEHTRPSVLAGHRPPLDTGQRDGRVRTRRVDRPLQQGNQGLTAL